MGTHRMSIIRQAIERLDSKMAIGESRHTAKMAALRAAQARGETLGPFSTGLIHSHKTRTGYQEHILLFLTWVRSTFAIRCLEDLDPRADELACVWLQLEVDAGKSPFTLQTERSALRLFFGDRELASSVPLPARQIQTITRSRLPAARDRHFQPANWPDFMTIEQAYGLRRGELERLLVADIHYCGPLLVAHVSRGKGGQMRNVPSLDGTEPAILAVIAGRDPEETVLAKVPDTDIHALRREYAQALYRQYAPGAPALPPLTQRLRSTDYDVDAVRRVSEALGHHRLDVILSSYLR